MEPSRFILTVSSLPLIETDRTLPRTQESTAESISIFLASSY
jgi:hypothetical protein